MSNKEMSLRIQVKLGEVCEIFGGGTPSRGEAAYFTGDIPWVTPTEIDKTYILPVSSSKEYITEAAVKQSSAKILYPGTVLLTSRASIGNVAIAASPLTTNQGFINFVCGERIYNKYLAYWLRSHPHLLDKIASGTTFKEVSRSKIRELEIPLPPLPEQHRIANLLERLDSARLQRRQVAALTETFLRASFMERFGDPVVNPKNWDTIALSEVAIISSGITKGRNLAAYATTQRPYLRVANVQDGRLALKEIKFIELKESECEKFELKYGDVLLTEGGDPDKLGRSTVWKNEIEGCVH